MNILIIGLGLIGGSFCKTLSKKTNHNIFGYDKDNITSQKALNDGSIISVLSTEKFIQADVTFICLHPTVSINFLKENVSHFRGNSVIADVCGVKGSISAQMSEITMSHNINYIGTHPMAGREFGGYDYSVENLFDNASFIVTPTESTDMESLETVKKIATEMGFKKIITASPENHDKTIAYTSQLAHIVSSAYVKSPSIENESGFTAGSFQDMTRIATLNENMWSDLFMQNQKPLLNELDTLISNLAKYREAIADSDADKLTELLREGRIIKERDLSIYSNRK